MEKLLRVKNTSKILIGTNLVADMRKALSRDKEKKSIIPLDHPVRPEDVD